VRLVRDFRFMIDGLLATHQIIEVATCVHVQACPSATPNQ
jgi:hypothetical protein